MTTVEPDITLLANFGFRSCLEHEVFDELRKEIEGQAIVIKYFFVLFLSSFPSASRSLPRKDSLYEVRFRPRQEETQEHP